MTTRSSTARRGSTRGSLDGADGLWVRVSPSRLRFYDLRGEARGEVTEERAGCAREGVPRGVIHRVEGAADVQGDGWRVEAGEWVLEETLRVYDGVACTAAVGGGEPREEPPPPREAARRAGRCARSASMPRGETSCAARRGADAGPFPSAAR